MQHSLLITLTIGYIMFYVYTDDYYETVAGPFNTEDEAWDALNSMDKDFALNCHVSY